MFEVAEDAGHALDCFGSAKEAAHVYAALCASLPGTCRAQDYERLALAGVQLNARPEVRASQIRALDVRRDLERCWQLALEMLREEEGERAAAVWSCWWSVRVGQLPLSAQGGMSKTTAARRVACGDRVVLRALEQLELRRFAVSEAGDRHANADCRRVRTAFYSEQEG